MRRNAQRGEGRLKSILALAVIAGIIYFGFRTIPVYINNFELEDAMKTEARFAAVQRKSPDEVRDVIYRKIQELKIPARREDIQIIQLGGGGLRITVTYTVIIEFPGYKWKINFSPSADNMSV